MVISWFKLGDTLRVNEKHNATSGPLRGTIFRYCQPLKENTARLVSLLVS